MRFFRALFVLVALVPSVTAPGIAASAPDEVSSGQWYVGALNLAEAHKISTGSGAKIALLDSGVDAVHPALKGSIDPGANFVTEQSDSGFVDLNGHGTSLAGLMVGHGQIHGVAPDARVVSITSGLGSAFPGKNGLAQGLDWAVAHGLNIVCIASDASPDRVLSAAIDRAIASDVVIVAAAGNKPEDAGVIFPASSPGVLAVGGTDRSGHLSSISVSGADLSLVAPADRISVARPNAGYALTTGTSNSSALVAGAVALIRSKYPQLSAKQVIFVLTSTAIDEGQPGRDFDYGYGRIDIVAALKKAGTMQPEPSAKPSATFPTSTTATVTATSPEPKSGPSTAVLATIIIGGLLAAAVIVVLVIGLSRRT